VPSEGGGVQMSELKAHRIDNIISAYKIGKAFCMKTEEEVYIKSEADKVIAHNKYKRCLAMAEWCNSEMGRETFACFRPRHTKEVWREEHKYWAKWRKIWFELYKKLKPNKSTAQ
jgi:hypothetical protein